MGDNQAPIDMPDLPVIFIQDCTGDEPITLKYLSGPMQLEIRQFCEKVKSVKKHQGKGILTRTPSK